MLSKASDWATVADPAGGGGGGGGHFTHSFRFATHDEGRMAFPDF